VSIAPPIGAEGPAYAVGVLSGLGEAAKQQRAYEWQPVFDLARAIIGRPRLLPARDEREDYELTRGWVDGRLEVAHLLDAGLRHDRIPAEADSDVFELLAALATDPDPSLADDQRHDEANTGPVTLDLNTVRGAAFHAIVQYAWWRKKQTPPSQTPSLDPRLRELLDRHLDPEHEPTRAIRSVYGQFFPALLACDQEWARARVDAIFPYDRSLEHLRRAAWDRYLLFNRASPQRVRAAHRALPRGHHPARSGNLKQAPDRVDDEATDALTRHVLGLYAQGAVGREPGSLVDLFFERAPVGMRAHLIEMAGIVTSTEQPSPVVLERLQRLWEWRLGVLQAREDSDLEELQGFGWWFGSGKFDDDWALGQLHDLLASEGTVDPDHMVAERLAALCQERPAQVVACLSLLIDATHRHAAHRPWFVTAARDDIQVILGEGIAAEDAETRRLARETVNRLIARGHTEFADLLS
jgi:hypothetical protein